MCCDSFSSPEKKNAVDQCDTTFTSRFYHIWKENVVPEDVEIDGIDK